MEEQDIKYGEEEEISLLDYLMVLVRHKRLIVAMVFFAGVASVVISLSMTNIYRSDATIAPRGKKTGPPVPFPAWADSEGWPTR